MSKKILLLFVVIVVIMVLALTWFVFYGRNDANMVLKVPSGFVHLQSNLKNGLNYTGFETQITFIDVDGVAIYSTGFKNSDFIVKYKGEYYVNEDKLLDITDVAAISPEQRRKTYNMGDGIEIRGTKGTVFTVKIVSLETGETEPFYEDSLTTYTVKYTITPDITENERLKFFALVETKKGVEYSSIDSIDVETVSVKIRKRENDEVAAIILKSPEYPGLIYRVVLNK